MSPCFVPMSVRDALDEPTEPITFPGYVMSSRS